VAMTIFLTGCSSTPSRPTTDEQHTSGPSKAWEQSTAREYSKGQQIVSIADSLIGSPYRYGGASPRGFDCSGLVYYTHQQLDIAVPRTTKEQARYRPHKQLKTIQPGDILFFRIYGRHVSHVGIYAGNQKFIHAPKSGKYVSYASINEPYWRERMVKVATLY